jgi:hypothetical protein
MINIKTGLDCPEGQELVNVFFSSARLKKIVTYKYRHDNSKLFVCTADDVHAARKQRDLWLQGVN